MILRETTASGIPVQIGYPRRFDSAFAEARRAVAAGELGFIHTVRSTTLDPAPPPDAYIASSGGIFRDCSVHDFDAVRFVTGQEVVEVYAVGSNQGADIFAENDDVDTSATLLTSDLRRVGRRVELPLQRPRPRRSARAARIAGQHRRRG